MIGRRLRVLPLVLALVLTGCAGLAAPPATVGMIEVPDGCPDLYERLRQIADEEVATPGTGVDVSRDRTAAQAWGESESIDTGEIRRFYSDLHREFTFVTAGRLSTVGIDVEVRSDSPELHADLDALDALVRLVLDHDYDDLRVRALMACYRERIIEDGELADSRLRLYVPADPGLCFSGLVLASREEARCDAIGVAVPEIEMPDRLGLRLRWPATIAIAPGQLSDSVLPVETRAAIFLAHELVHYLDNVMGAPPRLMSLAAYERRAYYVQDTIGGLVDDDDLDLPTPLMWKATP